MKSRRIIAILCLSFIIVTFVSCASEAERPAKKGDISIMFDYEKKWGFSTNQFAVWIEDTEGNLIKPLFVTKYTEGNWKKNSDLLPIWADLIGKDDGIDAMTGSTPKKSGRINYIWDLTNKSGVRVTNGGSYVFVVEATVRKDNRALFKGEFKLTGDRLTAKSDVEYFGGDTKDRGMIKNVFAIMVQ